MRSTILRRAVSLACSAGVVAGTQFSQQTTQMAPSPPPLELPAIGLGLWKSAPGEVGAAVKEALKLGCRLLDGAAAYGNEAEVGAAIAEALGQGVVRREDIWIVSKLFNTHHVWNDDKTRPTKALDTTLRDLQLEQLDLYLMHWPVACEQTDLKSLGGLRLADGTPNPKLTLKMEYLQTWGEMIELQRQGKVCRRRPSPACARAS